MANLKWRDKTMLLLWLLCLTNVTWASHMIAVEIRARPLNCDTRTYEITLIGYVNTASSVTFGGADTLSFGDGASIIVPEQLPVVIDPLLNIGRVQYTVVHTYASNGEYILSYREHARNSGIMNMDESGFTTFYTESSIAITQGSCDSSPYLTVPPIDRACSGIAFYHNAGAIDPDDDSVSFSFVIPRSNRNTEVIDYSYPNARQFYTALGMNYNQSNESKNAPPSFAIDPVDGTLTWDAPGLTGEYALAIKITGWRYNPADSSWVQSGFCIRDMQVLVEDCNNMKPAISVPDDLCVVAGEAIEFSVPGSDPDGDPVSIEAFSDIFSLTENPGMVSPVGAPLQSTVPPFDTAKLRFSWNTSCLNVKSQPYKVVFKITDRPPAGPRLARFESVSIRVIAPPPEFKTISVNPISKSVTLTWNEYFCENTANIQVWRRVSGYPYQQPECSTGMPYFLRYQLIATLPGDSDSYEDSELAIGAEYCYRVIALVGNKIPSRMSLDTCFIPKPAEAPVITKTSVINTSEVDGRIEVRWTEPFEIDKTQYPPPYLYKVYRSESGNPFQPATSVAQADTTFTDVGINTQKQPYAYRIELYVPALTLEPADTSSVAGSVFLYAGALPGKISLSWNANTPWYNYSYKHPYHLIYRSEVNKEGTFTLIDSVDVNEHGFHYIDSGKFQNRGLSEGMNYYYKILTRGSYGNPVITEPIENFSQIAGATTLDVTPPCTPIVAIESTDCATLDCSSDSYYNRVTWSYADQTCLEDGLTYRVFAADNEEGPFEPLATLQGSSFQHGNLSSLAKCYRVAAIDRFGNVSALSESVCNDNCPYFELPNVFTPGTGDGINEMFLAFGPDNGTTRCSRFVKQVDLTVYNRWGEKIYSISTTELNNDNMLWDGSFESGKEAESGIYYYHASVMFDVRDPAKQSKLFKGWIHLIRGD
jgi:hypothetical protein